MSVHEIKCHPYPFDQVLLGFKRHETRLNDRAYHEGDTVILCRFDPEAGQFTGQRIRTMVGHVTRGGQYGLPRELCVFTLLNVEVI